jgi:hypothetical protein
MDADCVNVLQQLHPNDLDAITAGDMTSLPTQDIKDTDMDLRSCLNMEIENEQWTCVEPSFLQHII